MASATAAADTQALTARAANARAEAAELRLKQLEREADGLASEVAALQVSEYVGRNMCTRTYANCDSGRVHYAAFYLSLAAHAIACITQERLGRGEMIRSGGVRVLHLRHNPEAEARQEAREAAVTQLRAENEALRGQVAELEAAVAKLQEQQRSDSTGAAGEGGYNAGSGHTRLILVRGARAFDLHAHAV